MADLCGGCNPDVNWEVVSRRTAGRPSWGLGLGVKTLLVGHIIVIGWAGLLGGAWGDVASVLVAVVDGEDDAE